MIIPIFFTIDENYAKYASTAIISLIDHSNKAYNYIVNIIHEKLSTNTIDKLKLLETSNVSINFYEMKNIEDIKDTMSNRLRADYFTSSIFFRIFIPTLFKEYDKAIYLDSDIIINKDISILFNIDLNNNLLGAVNDYSIVESEPLVNYVDTSVGVSIDKYINSGVLLMNLKGLREVSIDEKFLYLLNKYHFDSIAPDQDYLNAMCKNKIKYLDKRFDAMPLERGEEIKDPIIIHYNLFSKPWHYKGIPYEKYFWYYAKKSLFYLEIMNEYNNFNGKDKDKESMELLINRAIAISKNEITFKRYASKVEL